MKDQVELDLEAYIPWLRANTGKYAPKNLYEDFYQEGFIAMWEGRRRWTPETGVLASTYMLNQAKYRWLDLLRSGKYTGMDSRKGMEGKHNGYLGSETSHDFSYDHSTRSLKHPTAPDAYSDLVFHYPEIHEAVSELPEKQRQYVYARFWLGMWKAEIAENGIGRSAWTRARPRLMEQLAHLKDYA